MAELDLDFGLRLLASMDTLAAKMEHEEARRQRRAQALRQIPLVAPQIASPGGTIDSVDNLKAKTGYYWSVRRLAMSGFTAGTVTVYMNAAGGELVAAFATAGVATFGRGELLMHPDDRLVVVASGITGFVQLNGTADCFEAWLLPEYIG